jgi:hypothetical protein
VPPPRHRAAKPASPRRNPIRSAIAVSGIYFKREWYDSDAACLTAAYSRRLPLEVCR